MAREAGFDKWKDHCCSGKSDLDETLAVGEYAVGEAVFKLVKLAYAAGAAAERKKVAKWMIQRGYATGHGDTTEDLLVELDWQFAESLNRELLKGSKIEREACAKVVEEWLHGEWHNQGVVAALMIRERGAP